MELEIYTWIGRIAVWLFVGYVVFKILAFIMVEVINWLGKKFDTSWILIEYIYYRKDFKEWIKDKQRIVKKKKH